MVDSTASLSLASPQPSQQSAAALLPPEIVDCIFSHFDFDYSRNASRRERTERTSNLSNMSVVAEGWQGPARRLLCRTVRIARGDQLAEGVPEWARGGLRNVAMTSGCWRSPQTQETAGATSRFLKHAPNLRLLHLYDPPFHSFSASDSAAMRTTHLLPLLRDLTVFGDERVPHSVISDLLAASDYQVRRLRLQTYRSTIPLIPRERLDFGGNLRYLRAGGGGSGSSPLDYLYPVLRSLVGLKEMWLDRIEGQPSDSTREIFAAVGPTLEKLTIDDGDVNEIVDSFPLLSRLTHLSLPSIPSSLQSLPLPPSLVSLQFYTDKNLLPLFDRWNAEPSLFPATLQRLDILFVQDYRTFGRLPLVAEFGTVCGHPPLENMLRQLSPRTLRFTTLSVYFHYPHSGNIAVVEAECRRLEVKFCRNLDMWTH